MSWGYVLLQPFYGETLVPSAHEACGSRMVDARSELPGYSLPNLRYDASALVHDFEPELIEGVLIHDLDPSLACVGDGMVQVGEVDADSVRRDRVVEVNMEEVPWHLG